MTLNELLPLGYIDAHHHVWAPESLGDEIGYGWLRDIGAMKPFGDPTPIQRDYRLDEFLAEASAPPRISVHVQTDGALPDPVIETAFVAEEKIRTGQDVAIVGLADLSSNNFQETLERHNSYPEFVGVRHIVARLDHRPDLSFAAKDYLAESQWVAGLRAIEDLDLAFDLQMYPEQAETALEALSATPALRVVIDHALCPYDATEAGYERWKAAVALMAARPNTYMKLSGWGMYHSDWAAESVDFTQQYVTEILAAFGSNRVMWGSNYPVEKLATPYETCVINMAKNLTVQEREDVFIAAATEAYKLNLTRINRL